VGFAGLFGALVATSSPDEKSVESPLRRLSLSDLSFSLLLTLLPLSSSPALVVGFNEMILLIAH